MIQKYHRCAALYYVNRFQKYKNVTFLGYNKGYLLGGQRDNTMRAIKEFLRYSTNLAHPVDVYDKCTFIKWLFVADGDKLTTS